MCWVTTATYATLTAICTSAPIRWNCKLSTQAKSNLYGNSDKSKRWERRLRMLQNDKQLKMTDHDWWVPPSSTGHTKCRYLLFMLAPGIMGFKPGLWQGHTRTVRDILALSCWKVNITPGSGQVHNGGGFLPQRTSLYSAVFIRHSVSLVTSLFALCHQHDAATTTITTTMQGLV